MTTGADVVAKAREYIDTPFVHQGRVKGVGIDCAGLIICVARDLGIIAPDFNVTSYARQPAGARLIHECTRHMTRVSRRDIAPGDVIAMIVDQDPQHLVIVSEYDPADLKKAMIIHALSRNDSKGKVVETHLMFHRAQKFVAAFRMPGIV